MPRLSEASPAQSTRQPPRRAEHVGLLAVEPDVAELRIAHDAVKDVVEHLKVTYARAEHVHDDQRLQGGRGLLAKPVLDKVAKRT